MQYVKFGGGVFLGIEFFLQQCSVMTAGVAGLFDYGPMGCAMKSHLISQWRSHFILEEGLLEVDCSILTPDQPLK